MRPETFAGLSTAGSERVQVDDIMSVRETAGHLIEGFGSRTRAYVQVQNGCDHRCTFCIIPFGRGPSRSVPAGEIVAHVRRVVEGGCREVVLTGVDITSYGADLPGTPSLGALVRQILKLVPELERLRLSSIDQVEADAQLMRAIAEEERLMPHLHLSMQAGDDMVLKRMKRRHTRADAVQFCKDVLRMRPDTVFGADLIAGFPTETDAMFANSLSIVDDCNLTYSARLPLLAPRRHARRAHAAGRATRRKRAGCAAARQGRRHAVTLPRPARQLRGAAPGREGRRRAHAPVRRNARARRDTRRRTGARACQRSRRSASFRRGRRVSSKGAFSRLWGNKGADAPPASEAPVEATAEVAANAPTKATGWFGRLKQGLGKSSAKLTDGITGIFTKKKLEAATLDDLEDLLIEADLGVGTAESIITTLRKGRYEKGISADDVRGVLKSEVERVLAPVAKPLVVDGSHKPHVILIVGVNGGGKTTTIGKLAARLTGEGKKVMLAAGDTFRAAAIEQLGIWGAARDRASSPGPPGADAAGLVYDAMARARDEGVDVLLVDTAGRLQNKEGLMEELSKIVRVLRKLDAERPA